MSYQLAVDGEEELCGFLKTKTRRAIIEHLTQILAPDVLRHFDLLTHRKYQQAFLLVQQKSPTTDRHAVVTCEIKLFQNYFSLRRCPD